MAKELIFTQRFKDNYRALPSSVQRLFDRKLELFMADVRHPSLNVHRYHGRDDVWEAYLSKNYRFTFSFDRDTVTLRNIGPNAIIDRGQV